MSAGYTEVTVQKLVSALRDMIRVAQRATQEEVSFGPPCSRLIDVVMDKGLEGAAKEIIELGEFRLNGAGLKICYREGDGFTIPDYDQYRHYPTTGPILKEILEEKGLTQSSPIIGRRSIRY